MLKKALFFLLAFAMLTIYVGVVNAKPVSVKSFASVVEMQKAPPGMQAEVQLVNVQADVEFQITEAEQITHVSDVTIKGEILTRGMPPRVMDQIIKIDDDKVIQGKGTQTNYKNKGKLLLQRRYKHCELYPQLNMQYRS